jgi:hypothetical protein
MIKDVLKWIYESSPPFFVVSGILSGFQLLSLIGLKLGIWLFSLGGFIAFMFVVYALTWLYAAEHSSHLYGGIVDWWDNRPWKKESDNDEGI